MIADALKLNTLLKNLNLRSKLSIYTLYFIDNKIGDEGMKYLNESLKINNSIQTLGLECK